MANYIHRTTLEYYYSTSISELAFPVEDYIVQPDLTAVIDCPRRYWQVEGDVISLVSQQARDLIDANRTIAQRDDIADGVDDRNTLLYAVIKLLMSEINDLSTEVNDLGGSRPIRTRAQFKQALRNELDS